MVDCHCMYMSYLHTVQYATLSRDKDDGRSAYASTLLRARRSVFTGDGDNMMYHRYVRPQRCNMKLLQRGYGMESTPDAQRRGHLGCAPRVRLGLG